MSALAAPAATGRLYVGSEAGTLRRVVLHRPDLELRRLTPAAIAGAELGRGRGGPRCMSCPIDRDDLPGSA